MNPPRKSRAAFAERLKSRRGELERAAFVRVRGISDPTAVGDPFYVDGLSRAVSDGLDYALAVLERGEEHAPSVPATLLSQARVAARCRVGLDTVLRRYFAGYALLGDLLIEHAENDASLPLNELRQLLRLKALAFDQLITAISAEYVRESEHRPGSPAKRLARQVQLLLAGERLDTAGFQYDFDLEHVGIVTTGSEVGAGIRAMATALDQRCLLVFPEGGSETATRETRVVWAWLGARQVVDPDRIREVVPDTLPDSAVVAIGEPGCGLAGWRTTHRQAAAAWMVASRTATPVTRYVDVALLASLLSDDLLRNSLRDMYVKPLQVMKDGGSTLCRTLRVYLSTGRNVSSTAASLGVKRHTVTNRLRVAEELIGHPIDARAAEIKAVLDLGAISEFQP